ncbi:SulP family inorganic anion transporter [Azohydromonas aeria]|uniref:SulP family inorganic anion transporter n=1 Tax=Azohydromonas aeria TaxID=2590212 RepID=UPI0012FB905C|nr:SulP family inorganic anion transporter [Azohydromonas aeria]
MQSPVSTGPASAGALFRHLRHDLPAGVVVFLVALPLCLGIALASGVPLLAGIVSGVVGGLVVAALSGSQLSVSGPAAGLVVIVVNAIATLGSFEAFLAAVVLAGALQWLFGRLRAGDLGACFPSSVIKGMLAAIGLLLIIKQLPVAFGFASTPQLLQAVPDDSQALDAMAAVLDSVTEGAVLVAGGALLILFAWELPAVRRLPVLGRLPGALLAVLWGVGCQALLRSVAPAEALVAHQLVSLPEVTGWDSLLSQLASPDWSALSNPQIYTVALTLAVVASLETLLSLEATDRLDPLKRVAPPNRELQAQGIGNIVAGLLGGLPITAVIVRSSANIQAGARTRLSAMLHGVLLLASVLLLVELLRWIPLAALAAVLLHTGWKLAKPAVVMAAWRQGAAGFVPFAVTVAGILATDLLMGIGLGLATSLLFLIHASTRGALSMTSRGQAHLLQLSKDVSFFNKARLREHLERVQPGHSLIIDGARCSFIDRDIREALDDFVAHARQRHIGVELRSMPPVAPEGPSRPRRGWRGEAAVQSA